MTKLFRQAPYADFEVFTKPEDGLSVKILLERLKWHEWDQLVKAVNEARPTTTPGSQELKSLVVRDGGETVVRNEKHDLKEFPIDLKVVSSNVDTPKPAPEGFEVIKFGSVIKGDWVNGNVAESHHFGRSVDKFVIVQRKKKAGMMQVTEGYVQKGDLCWNERKEQWEAPYKDGMKVKDLIAVYRPKMLGPEWEKIIVGYVIKGDIDCNHEDTSDRLKGGKIVNAPGGFVWRKKLPGHKQVTGGTAQLGDLMWDAEKCEWVDATVGRMWSSCYALYRPNIKEGWHRVTVGSVIPGDYVDDRLASSEDRTKRVVDFKVVQRQNRRGYLQVQSGDVQKGDLFWLGDHWKELPDAKGPVKNFMAVYRPIRSGLVEAETVVVGCVIPGDFIDGRPATKSEFYEMVAKWHKGTVKRPIRKGYTLVTEGFTRKGDLAYATSRGDDGDFGPANVGASVANAIAIYRPIMTAKQEVITTGQTIPGDIVNNVVVNEHTAYAKIKEDMLVIRNIRPGYDLVTEGLTKAGDEYWNRAHHKWSKIAALNQNVEGYSALYRPINTNLEIIRFGNVLPGDYVNGEPVKKENIGDPITRHDQVLRQKIKGWDIVTEGDAKVGDIYFDRNEETWKAVDKDRTGEVKSFWAVYRPSRRFRVTHGSILPGDIVNGKLADESLLFVTISDNLHTVERVVDPDWRQVTTGVSVAGDQCFNKETRQWQDVGQLGDYWCQYHCLRRRTQNDPTRTSDDLR